jgi:uncharacterized protein (DUF58 family)
LLRDPDVQRCLDGYQLGLPRIPTSGRSGELLGRGTGSSLEFQEYRQYMAGDDIRHLDWAAYARSDQLMVRLYREEISPRTQVFVDTSRSMNTGEQFKPLVTRQLASLFTLLSARLGGQPQLIPLTDDVPLRPVGVDGLEQFFQTPFQAQGTLSDLLERHAVPLKSQGLRIVISDFLFPHDADRLIRSLAAGASVLWVIQVLNEWEARPTPVGGRRLIDAESGSELDLQIDSRTVQTYLKRLNTLQTELQRNCRRANATFVTVIADQGLEAICRGDLTAAAVLRAA